MSNDDLLLPLDDAAGPALRTSERNRRMLVDGALAARHDDLAMSLDDGLGPALPLSRAAVQQMVARAQMRHRPAAQTISTRPAPTPLTMTQDEPLPTPSRGMRLPARGPRPWVMVTAAAAALVCGFSLRGFVDRGRAPAAAPGTASIGAGSTPAPTVVATPQSLLVAADDLRREERWAAADAAYAKLAADFSGTPEAEQATLSRAYLQLEHLGDAQRALALYDVVVQGKGAGAVEAELGRTFALRALGRRRAELEALRALVVHHPTSPLRYQAEQRLRELEPR